MEHELLKIHEERPNLDIQRIRVAWYLAGKFHPTLRPDTLVSQCPAPEHTYPGGVFYAEVPHASINYRPLWELYYQHASYFIELFGIKEK